MNKEIIKTTLLILATMALYTIVIYMALDELAKGYY